MTGEPARLLLGILLACAALVLAASQPMLRPATHPDPLGQGGVHAPPSPTPPLPPPPTDLSLKIEEAISGRVLEVLPDGFRLDTSEGAKVLRTSPSTTIDEGLWVAEIPVQVGDHIFAWGHPGPDGSFLAEEIWVNWVNVTGPVSGLAFQDGGVEFLLRDLRRGTTRRVRIDARNLVSFDGQQVTAHFLTSNTVKIRNGEIVQVIGRGIQEGDVVIAVNILGHPPGTSAP